MTPAVEEYKDEARTENRRLVFNLVYVWRASVTGQIEQPNICQRGRALDKNDRENVPQCKD